MTDAPKEIPSRVAITLDRERSIGYDFRTGIEWTREANRIEIRERVELGLPYENFKKRSLGTFDIGNPLDLSVMLWVMLRRTDPQLTLETVQEQLGPANQKVIIEAVASVMNMTVTYGRKQVGEGGEPEKAEEGAAKN